MATAPFAAPLVSPKFRAFDANGAPLNAGQVFTYIAGTTTPLASYPTYTNALAGTSANANPVILDANGEAAIFLTNALYKVLVKSSVASGSVTQYTMDSVGPALAFPQPYPGEWVQEAGTVVYSLVTQFKVSGVDATGVYHVGRRIKTINTGGTVYSTVVSSSFATDTTVNVVNDSGTLDAGLSAVYYGALSYNNPAYLDKRSFLSVVKSGNQTGFAASSKITTWTVEEDSLSEWSAANNRWVCKYPGVYVAMLSMEFSDTVASQVITGQIAKSGAVTGSAVTRSAATGGQITNVSAHLFETLTAAAYIEAFCTGTANTTVYGTVGTRLSVFRVV